MVNGRHTVRTDGQQKTHNQAGVSTEDTQKTYGPLTKLIFHRLWTTAEDTKMHVCEAGKALCLAAQANIVDKSLSYQYQCQQRNIQKLSGIFNW